MNHLSTIMFSLTLGFSSLSLANQAISLEQASAALKAGNIEQAVHLFKQHKNNSLAMLQLAKIYMDNDLDEAEEWIEKASAQQPDNAEIHYWRGRIMGGQAQSSIFSALGYAGKSLDSFTRAVELMPSSVSYRKALMQFHLQAPSIAGGDLEIAKEQVLRITELDVKAGLKAEVDYTFARNDDVVALQLLNDGMEAFSDIPDFYFEAGMVQQRQEHYQEAFGYFTQAIAKQAVDEESIRAKYAALYQLGKTSVLSEQNIEAGINSLKEYVAQAPDLEGLSPKYWAEYRLANLYALNDQKMDAKEIYLRLAESSNQEVAKQAKKAAKKL